MRSALVAVAVIVAVASAQREAIPECGLKCLDEDPDVAEYCAGVDPAICICTNDNALAIVNTCVSDNCSGEDLVAGSQAAYNICAPIWSASATGRASETEAEEPTSSDSGDVPTDSSSGDVPAGTGSAKPRPSATQPSAGPTPTITRPSDSVASPKLSIGAIFFAALALAL